MHPRPRSVTGVYNTWILLNLLTTPLQTKHPFFLSIATTPSPSSSDLPLHPYSSTFCSSPKPRQGRESHTHPSNHPLPPPGGLLAGDPPPARPLDWHFKRRWHFNLFPTAAIRCFCFHLYILFFFFFRRPLFTARAYHCLFLRFYFFFVTCTGRASFLLFVLSFQPSTLLSKRDTPLVYKWKRESFDLDITPYYIVSCLIWLFSSFFLYYERGNGECSA